MYPDVGSIYEPSKKLYHNYWRRGPSCALIPKTKTAVARPSQFPHLYTESTRPNPKIAKSPDITTLITSINEVKVDEE